MMRFKSNTVFAMIIFLVLLLVGCGLQPLDNIVYSDEGEDINTDFIVVGFSQLGSESDWRTANTKSIQDMLSEENGFYLLFSNGRQKQENQIKAVRNFISQEVDYIVIAPVIESGWDTVLKEAKEAGIPVIISDRMVDVKDDSLYVTHVGSDFYQEGIKAGEWLERNEEKIGSDEKLNIVVLKGTLGSTAQIGRTEGLKHIAFKNPNWNILAQESGDFTKAKGREVMEKYLDFYSDIDVLVSQNDDMTFGAIEAIEAAGLTCGMNGDIAVISFDAVAEAFDFMEQGFIDVDVECNPLGGAVIVEVINKLEKGETVEKNIYVEEKVFLSKNALKDKIGREY